MFPAACIADTIAHGDLIMTGFPTVLIGNQPPRGARGVVGKHPGIEVEISAEDMQLIRSCFVR